jgi:hypothetical protein
MTDKITLTLTLDELKTLDKYVELNEETKSVFDKIKYAYPQPKMTLQQEGDYAVVSYNDTTYYRLMGEDATCFAWYHKKGVSSFPTLVMVTDAETERLLEDLYYNHIEVKKETAQERGERVHNEMEEVVRESVKWCEEHKNENPLDWLTPKTPEETAESLREAFVKAQQTEKWKELQRKIDEEDNDKNFKNSLDLIKEWGEKNKPPTLYQLIENWWCDVFCANSTDDMETCIDGLVDKIDSQFIPPSHDTNDYQWNKCLKIMRDKLR